MNLFIVYILVSDCHTIQYTVHEYLPIIIAFWQQTIVIHILLSEILPSLMELVASTTELTLRWQNHGPVAARTFISLVQLASMATVAIRHFGGQNCR